MAGSDAVDLDLGRVSLAGDGEAVPCAIDERGIEAIESVLDPTAEDDIEISGRPRPDPDAQLHRRTALDDEQVSTIVVVNIVEHRAHHTDSHQVHHALGQLPDLGGMTLQQPLELLGTPGTIGHLATTPVARATSSSRSGWQMAPRWRAVSIAWRAK